MGKETVNDLAKFLSPYPDNVKVVALWLRQFVWDIYPESNELIYVDALSVAIGFSPSDRAGDKFCSIAVHANHVNFGLNKGSAIADPSKILSGTGIYRFISVTDIRNFPVEYIQGLLAKAYENSLKNLKQTKHAIAGQTIVKSVSPAAKVRLAGHQKL